MPAAIVHDRRSRHRRQLTEFLDLMSANLDLDDQVDVLFATWPQRLPRRVWREMNAPQRAGWRQRRAEFEVIQAAAWIQEHQTSLAGWLGVDVEEHAAGIEAFFALMNSLPNLSVVKLVIFPPIDPDEPKPVNGDPLIGQWDREELVNPSRRNDLIEWLAIALTFRAGMELVQELPLRVQRPDETGTLVWQAQERCWGAAFEGGEAKLLDGPTIRGIVTANWEGTLPAGLSFGDLDAHARKTGILTGLRAAGIFTE